MIFQGSFQAGLFYNYMKSVMDVLPQNCSECAMSFFPSQLVRVQFWQRGDLQGGFSAVFFISKASCPCVHMSGLKRLTFPFQGCCLVTSSSMDQMISYRDQTIFFFEELKREIKDQR